MRYFYKENPVLEEQVNAFFAFLEKENQKQFQGALSVLLLGSMSRGEATWMETPKGFSLVSDIEFFTVYPDGFERFSDFSACIEKAKKEIFADQDSILFHIDNTYVKKSSLPLMERKLITYDAMEMGKTVVGEDVVSLLPEITLENINLWDIKDILTHRVFFVLYYGEPLKNAGKTEEYRYLLAKNSLDLMTVMLAHHGQLASGFIRRLEKIQALPISREIKDYFDYCLCIKLSKELERNYSTEEMEKIFLSIVKDLANKFHVPLKNTMTNKRHVAKRCMGILKRAVKNRWVPNLNHLAQLMALFEEQKSLSVKHKKNNLVLNGYPIL